MINNLAKGWMATAHLFQCKQCRDDVEEHNFSCTTDVNMITDRAKSQLREHYRLQRQRETAKEAESISNLYLLRLAP